MGAGRRRKADPLQGRDIAGLRADQIAQRGIGYVPEDRDIFPALTVRQNLSSARSAPAASGAGQLDDMFALFPQPRARADTPAGVLSGGEQQMLTMCRTLMGDPDLIMIDEPTEGLAPMLVEQVGDLLERSRARGVVDPAGGAEADDRAADLAARST